MPEIMATALCLQHQRGLNPSDKRTDIWTEKWTDGKTDRPTDRQTDIFTSLVACHSQKLTFRICTTLNPLITKIDKSKRPKQTLLYLVGIKMSLS